LQVIGIAVLPMIDQMPDARGIDIARMR